MSNNVDLNLLDMRIASLDADIKLVQEQISPLFLKVQQLSEARSKAIEARSDILAAADMPWGQMMAHVRSGSAGMSLLRKFDKRLNEEFSMYSSGTWSDTEDPALGVGVARDSLNDELKAIVGIKTFVPMLKSHDDGRVWFCVLDYTLSANGIMSLKVRQDMAEAVLTRTVYGRERVKKTFGSVEEAVKYIRQNHWYE